MDKGLSMTVTVWQLAVLYKDRVLIYPTIYSSSLDRFLK